MSNYIIRSEIFFDIESNTPDEAKENAEKKLAEFGDEIDDYEIISIREKEAP